MAVLASVTPFYAPGVTRVVFCPTLANPAAPTRTEINAGTRLTRIRSFDGWNMARDQVEAPDMDTDFVSKVGGRYNADDSSLTFYGAKDGVDVRGLFQVDDEGFLLFQDGGDVEDYLMDVFPVLVIGVPKQRGDSDPFGIQVQFSIPEKPHIDVPIPAAA